MWELNPDDFFGTVPKGSQGLLRRSMNKFFDAGFVVLEGIVEQDRWSAMQISDSWRIPCVIGLSSKAFAALVKKTSMH